jgi:uncharacterized protein
MKKENERIKEAVARLETDGLIEKYFRKGSTSFRFYYTHCRYVRDLALRIAERHPEMGLDLDFVTKAAMLHDVGICLTWATEIGCTGKHPYIAHGYLGRELLDREGYGEYGPVCERHIGVGITQNEIRRMHLPLPLRDMVPVTPEEKLVCYADKFYSKTPENLTVPKSLEVIRKKLLKYGKDKLGRFNELVELFGTDAIPPK